MKFTKMQGAGNDYVYVDCTQNELKNASEVAVAVSDRHFGIGSDGLILIKKSDKADFFMEMYNADGSQVRQRYPLCRQICIRQRTDRQGGNYRGNVIRY